MLWVGVPANPIDIHKLDVLAVLELAAIAAVSREVYSEGATFLLADNRQFLVSIQLRLVLVEKCGSLRKELFLLALAREESHVAGSLRLLPIRIEHGVHRIHAVDNLLL